MFYDNIIESSNYIKEHINIRPKIMIILGSGLSKVVEALEEPVVIPFKDIPYFPTSNLVGHNYQMIAGKVGKQEVLLLQGRFHYYEGYSMKQVSYPVYVGKMLGIEKLLITNACGAINQDMAPGDLMLIDDFINTVGNNPLIGENDERLGPRFCDMSEPYDLASIDKMKRVASSLNIELKQGVYALFQGPYYETKAEIRMLKTMGADVVGMSTVPETIVANYLGIKVIGLACITNMATGIRTGKHSHEEVVMIANKASDKMVKLLSTYLKED